MSPLRPTVALAATVALTVAFAPVPDVPPTGSAGGAAVAPEPVPDRGPVLSEPIRRGELDLREAAARRPSEKVVDGDASDWIGTATRVGGTSRFDAGELVHSDFLFDAHGADDGGDRDRLDRFAGLFYEEPRAERIDQVLRTSGSQLGVPEPLGAPDEYGDVDGGLDVADLREVRLASDGEDLQVLVSVNHLDDPDRLGVLVLADTLPDTAAPVGVLLPDLGLTGPDLGTSRYDTAVLASAGTATVATHDGVVARATTATGAEGYENHLELSVDLAAVADRNGGGTVDVAVVAGRVEDDGGFTPLNVAFRGAEPVEIWNDRAQALALLDGSVDAFSSGPVDLADLTGGRTQDWAFGPGYFERTMTTARPAMTREGGQDGIHQPYGLYVPTAYDPGDVDQRLAMTYWLHYRGGKAHSGTVINPRLTTQLGEERDNLVVFPHARGTSEWYVTESHQDVLDVMADAEQLFTIDPARRYVSGYSMGGYGSWLFASLYPDMFAAAFVQSGAITQGAWVGTGAEDDPVDPAQGQGYLEANGGDAAAQLTHRTIENLRHVPFAIDHGTNDELVPVTGVERMAEKLTRLGYEHRFTRFIGYEHFTQAAVDEWADGAAYLDRFTIDPDPRQVTYSVVPALVHALNTVDPARDAVFDFSPDGAYWVDDIVVREPGDRGDGRPALDAKGTVEAISHAIGAPGTLTVPDAGVASPPGQSTPYLRTGLQHVEDPAGLTTAPRSNLLDLTLTNVAGVVIDTARAGLQRDGATLELATDGATTARFSGLFAGTDPDPEVVLVQEVGGSRLEARSQGDDLVVVVDGPGSFTVVLP